MEPNQTIVNFPIEYIFFLLISIISYVRIPFLMFFFYIDRRATFHLHDFNFNDLYQEDILDSTLYI